MLNAYDLTTGNLVRVGDAVKTFRGEDAVLTGLERANETGRDGKIVVDFVVEDGEPEQRGFYYARVCGLEVRDPGALHVGTFRETCSSHGCRGCIR
jgi:hypothetical protein